MLYQYHCACCNKVVASNAKVCTECGSQNIKSPYGFWLFCIFACLAAAIVVQMVHIYVYDQQAEPVQQSFLDALQQNDAKDSR